MLKFKNRILIVLILLFSVSCLDTPDIEPVDIDEQLSEYLLGAEYETAMMMGGDFAKYPLMWMQHISGITGFELQVERYSLENTAFDYAWETYYMSILQRLRYLEFYAFENEAPVYQGVSLVLQAYVMGMMSDAWGAMPSSEANNYYAGSYIIAYDSQEALYEEIFNKLDDGIMLLQDPNPGDILPDDTADVFYGGSVESWIKAARLIQLKFSLRLAHRMDYYALSYQYLQMGGLFTSVNDDMYFPFNKYSNVDNPWLDPANIRAGERLVDLMVETDDPRLTRFIRLTPGNEYVGVAPGTGNTNQNISASRIENTTNAIGAADSRLYLLSYAEQKFIESELYVRMDMQAQADAAYREAVEASLEMYNVRDAEWESQHANKEGVDLEEVITAKYQALFLNPEVWTDWRRTGYPSLMPAFSNGNDDVIPRRFLYPDSELMNNQTNVPTDITLNSHLWWDTP